MKTKDNKYIWDNFDFQRNNEWSYTFDRDSITFDKIVVIGIAANNNCGKTEVCKYQVEDDAWEKVILN